MRLWAFGTSPYGLALSEKRLWTLSPREFEALRAQWARHQAILHNGALHRKDGQMWEPAHFGATMSGPRQTWQEQLAVMQALAKATN